MTSSTSRAGLLPRSLCRGVTAHPLAVSCRSLGTATSLREPGSGEPTRDDGPVLDGLRRAVEHGATLLDTADCYGNGRSERLVGQVLREYPELKIHLSTKVGRVRGSAPHPYAGRRIHQQLQQSLDNLYTDHIDVYILDSFDFGPDDCYLGTAVEQLHTLRELGYISAIGMRGPHTRYGAPPEEQAAQSARFAHLFRKIGPDVVWNRSNGLTPVPRIGSEDLFSFTARRGVGLLLAAPLAHGLLTGRAPGRVPTTYAPWFTRRALDVIAAGLRELRGMFGDTPGVLTRLALRSCLQRADHAVVVAGFRDVRQAEENYTCLGEPLTDAELTYVDKIFDRVRVDLQSAGARHSVIV